MKWGDRIEAPDEAVLHRLSWRKEVPVGGRVLAYAGCVSRLSHDPGLDYREGEDDQCRNIESGVLA